MSAHTRRALFVSARTTGRRAPDLVSRHQVKALARHGWTVDLVARGPFAHPNVNEVPWLWLPSRAVRSLAHATKLGLRARMFGGLAARLLRRRRYDAVITWNGLGWRIFPEAERCATPYFLNCGNFPNRRWDPQAPQPPARWPLVSAHLVRAEYFASEAQVLVASEHALQAFVATGCPKERLHEIGRGFDPEIFHPGAAPRVQRPFRLLFCGRLSERKGVFRLLELWRELALDEAELWLCGPVPGENRARIESLATPSVRILGYRTDVADVMRQCDAQILLSSNEGMAKALLEGAACGLVTIATPETGFPFHLGDVGEVVDGRDREQVARAVRSVLGDRSRLAARSERAARLLAEQYTWEAAGDRFVSAIERGLEACRNASCREGGQRARPEDPGPG